MKYDIIGILGFKVDNCFLFLEFNSGYYILRDILFLFFISYLKKVIIIVFNIIGKRFFK